jgi:hypothetical protein
VNKFCFDYSKDKLRVSIILFMIDQSSIETLKQRINNGNAVIKNILEK